MTMTTETVQRLNRLRNDATLYELIAVAPDGRQVLAGYCGRTVRRMVSMLHQNATAWMRLTGAARVDAVPKMPKTLTLGEWTFRFSGRTEREAIMHGELPWIGDQP